MPALPSAPPCCSLAWVPMNIPLLDTSLLSWKGFVLKVWVDCTGDWGPTNGCASGPSLASSDGTGSVATGHEAPALIHTLTSILCQE